ncbi:MAG: 3-deoxy-7-phosphoheptulonate synthase [Spirochaetales bacterium]|nr:3-deoxy-7-phosphoheptulonate synthase [Spirochaetales bacterium]
MTGTDTKKVFDLRIKSATPLVAPEELKKALPLKDIHYATIVESRQAIRNIIHKNDDRLLGIVGPCSIHDRAAAIEYAHRLVDLRDRVSRTIYLIMRVYFEKPRTALGWRGLITDPNLDGSYDIAAGLQIARRILLETIGMGLPVGSEMLDPIVPQYVDDLISWAAIGARTTESQTHREMASGLSMPVGFKNGTDGSYESAINALRSSRSPHSFIGIDQHGNTCTLTTTGNPDTHVISRGANQAPNYSPVQLSNVQRRIADLGMQPAILIDCSHGNSGKDHTMQEWVLRSTVDQRRVPNDSIIGFMIESNLSGGGQAIPDNLADLQYGVSITDGCVGWEDTERMILDAHDNLMAGRDG